MSKFVKNLLIVLAANIGTGVFLVWLVSLARGEEGINLAILFLITACIALLVQALVALNMLTNDKKKETGKAMLLGVGLVLLIGLAICSGIMR